MSRKHFVALAANIARIENLEVRKQTAQAVAAVCADCNGNFDRARFFRACGVE